MRLQRILFVTMLIAALGRGASAQVYSVNLVGYLPVQGVLHENGQPINGFMDFCWGIFAAPSGGTRLATDTNMNNNVLVSNGVATLVLNVGDLPMLGLSPTQELWLELDLRHSGTTNPFTVLSPRQRIVPAMFASMAVRAEEARRLIEPLSEDLLPPSVARLDRSAAFAGPLSFGNSVTFGATAGPPFSVRSSAMVAGLTATAAGTASYAADSDKLDGLDSSAFWQLLGNAGTVPGVNFLGTTDNQPLELKVNNARALRLEPKPIAPNVIAGSSANAVTGTEGASIGGGHLNAVKSLFGVISGGAENLIDANGENSTISGGRRNTIQSNAMRSTIGGGATNTIQIDTDFATISGGVNNNIRSDYATIGGGQTNVIWADAPGSTIGGGRYHFIGGATLAATIAGGSENYVDTSANYSTIGGGQFNRVNANSYAGTIGGGVSNKVDQAAIFSTVSGGYSNVVARPASAIGGGQYNLVTAPAATIGGGVANQIQLSAKGSAIGGGTSNVVENVVTNGVIAGGFGNTIHSNANFSAIGGGRGNDIGSTAPFATIPGGREAKAFNYGQVAYASGGFGGLDGTAQGSFYVLRGATVDNTQTELFLDGAGERVRVPASSTWAYDVLVTARDSAAASAGFQIRGMMGYNAAGNLVALGAPIIQQLSGAGVTTAQVLPDNINKALTVKVGWGLANPQTARWVATVRTAEVVFPE